MTRPIKFKVFDGVDYMSQPFTLQDIQDGKIQFTSDCTILQFTGLTDRNGVEVYEGDILKMDFGNRVFFIEWNNSSMCYDWVFYVESGKISSDLATSIDKSVQKTGKDFDKIIEVIGNIYQNPELMEGGNPA